MISKPTMASVVGAATVPAPVAFPSMMKLEKDHLGAKMDEMVHPSVPGVGSSMEKGATVEVAVTVPERV
jgi:hypothetical protein